MVVTVYFCIEVPAGNREVLVILSLGNLLKIIFDLGCGLGFV